jgi:tRNA A-37 threonylcarbamoyl transferase component Bud32
LTGRDGSVCWWWAVAPPAALAAVARELQAGHEPGGAAVVKAGARRVVWRVPGTAGGLLVKRFAVRGAERWKYLVRPSRARSEYRAMEAFTRLGLPVVRPVGFGERRAGRLLSEAWFIGRLVPDARTLAEALDEAARAGDDARAARLAREAVAVAAELHAHPWLHRDLHAGNLLLDASGRMLITDLHSVWRVPRLGRRQRLENLARLIFSLRGGLDLALAPALLRDYADRRGEPADALVRDALNALAAFEARYVRGRVARCLQDSSLFAVEAAPGGRLFRRRALDPARLSADLAEHERLLAEGGPRVLSRAPRSRVTLVGAPPDQHVVKEYVSGGVLGALRQALGAGRGRASWVGARRLEVLGIGTAEALALLERRDGSALLVTRALRGSRALRTLAPELQAGPAARRGAVALGLGHLVGRLAREGLRHADLSAKNVFVADGPLPPPRDLRWMPPARAALVELIDLDGLRTMRRFEARGLVRMLEQLADLPVRPSRTDLRRFAIGYAAGAGRELPHEVAEAALAGAEVRAAARLAALDRPAARS